MNYIFAVDAPIISILPRSPYKICGNTALVLLCTAEGLPVPQVRWSNSTDAINSYASGEKALVIKKEFVNTSITCIARNFAGGIEHITEKSITIIYEWYLIFKIFS